ncbi:MAG: hypothetical protein A4S14_09585 [Proteobacteria bacterium SG_bin9]|nr:MAG: hypothetical protein A4S14_09585 [Proteobacteria bacterium SG_bin9]
MLRSIFAAAVVLASATGAFAQSQADKNACSRDVSRFCRQQMADGDSAVQSCLMQNRSKLGNACSEVFKKHGL